MMITKWQPRFTSLSAWNPFEELAGFRRLFDEPLAGFPQDGLLTAGEWKPLMDVVETKDGITLKVEVPGMKQEDINISLEDNTLTVKGERKHESEVNDEGYPSFSTSGEAGTLDLQGTLTHELGHVLGLGELCYLGTAPPTPHPTDHLGQPIPACGSAGQAIREATMYPTPRPGKRTPEADDVAGICALYPRQDDPGFCFLDEDVGCGCAVATHSRARGGGLALLAALLWLARVARARHRDARAAPADPGRAAT